MLIPSDSESESMSESDGEIDDDVPSIKKMNERIETKPQPISTSQSKLVSRSLLTIK